MLNETRRYTLFPYTTLFRSNLIGGPDGKGDVPDAVRAIKGAAENLDKRIEGLVSDGRRTLDRKSTRLNSSHSSISYAVFCLRKKQTSSPTLSPTWLAYPCRT